MSDNIISRTGMKLDDIPEDEVRSCDVCGKRFLRGWSTASGFNDLCEECLHEKLTGNPIWWCFADTAQTVATYWNSGVSYAYIHVYYSSEHGCYLPG